MAGDNKTNNSLRRLQLFGFSSTFSMVAVFAAWTYYSDINGAVIASATIEAESYSKKVQHREGGNVLRIMVKDGDVVQAGQDLVVLDPTEVEAQLGITQGQRDEFLIKKARLEAQRDLSDQMVLSPELSSRAQDQKLADTIAGQHKLLLSTLDTLTGKQDQYNAQIGQLGDQIKGYEAQLESNKTQLALIKEETDSLRKLQAQGLVPATRVMSMDREAARISGDQGQLEASRAGAQSKIAEIKVLMLQSREEVRNQVEADRRGRSGSDRWRARGRRRSCS